MVGLFRAGGLLLLLSGCTASAGPVKHEKDFTFKDKIDCPGHNNSIYRSPGGSSWGVLCGWKTRSQTHMNSKPLDLTFEECIKKCDRTKDCTLVNWDEKTRRCNFVKNAKGKGYVKSDDGMSRVAIKLGRKKKVGKKPIKKAGKKPVKKTVKTKHPKKVRRPKARKPKAKPHKVTKKPEQDKHRMQLKDKPF